MSTTTAYSIKNHAALASFAKRFVPAVVQDAEAPVPPSTADFFGIMKMTENIELDDGPDATIDVQPDFRFIFAYICYYVASIYPELNVKGHPYMSTFSLIGYCMLLVNAHFLVCDLSARRTASHPALAFRNDAHLKDYLNVLLNAKIPSFLMPLIEQIAPTFDPRRNRIEYIPSLAAFSLYHDFGRFPVPAALLAAHHQVASVRSNADPSDLLARFYGLTLLVENNNTFHMGNLFGTHYNDGTNNVIHENWFNQIFESIYNPVVGRFLTARPTFAKINLAHANFQANTWNSYVYALSAQDENIQIMQDFVNAGSRFINSEDPRTLLLGQLLAKISGITILSHSIEPVTLPTWSHLKVNINTKTGTAPATEQDFKTFATKHKFLAAPADKFSKLKYPADDKTIETGLYLVKNKNYEKKKEPLNFETFDVKTHTLPYVFYFQPYDVSPSSLAFTVAIGIKIELAEIDGFTVPTPTSKDDLGTNNSQYLQAAVPMNHIRRINTTPGTIRIRERVLPDPGLQKIAIAFRDMARNVLPFFAQDHISDQNVDLNPFDPEENATSALLNATFVAGSSPGPLKMDDHFVYGWSSYRVVHKYKSPTPADMSMILSFRPIYGTNVTLSRSKNPAVLIPK